MFAIRGLLSTPFCSLGLANSSIFLAPQLTQWWTFVDQIWSHMWFWSVPWTLYKARILGPFECFSDRRLLIYCIFFLQKAAMTEFCLVLETLNCSYQTECFWKNHLFHDHQSVYLELIFHKIPSIEPIQRWEIGSHLLQSHWSRDSSGTFQAPKVRIFWETLGFHLHIMQAFCRHLIYQ